MLTAALTALLALLGTAVPPEEPATFVVLWVMPTPAGGWHGVPTAETSTWPQTIAPGGACGLDQWAWEVTYSAPQSVLADVLADGRLVEGEDEGLVVGRELMQLPPCVSPPLVTPTAPAASAAVGAVTYAG